MKRLARKMKMFPIEMPIYGDTFVHVFIGTKEQLEDHFKNMWPKSTVFDKDRNYGSFTTNDEDGNPCMFMLNGFSLNTAVHEATHAASKIMNRLGWTHDYVNEEPYTYMVAYIVSELNRLK